MQLLDSANTNMRVFKMHMYNARKRGQTNDFRYADTIDRPT